MNYDLEEHVLFQPRIYFGENLKEKLGIEKCPRIQSGADVYAAFSPLSSLSTRMLIAGAIDSQCRMLQWDLLELEKIEENKFCAAHAFSGLLEHGASRLFLVHNELKLNSPIPTDVMWATRAIADASKLMGYELTDHIVISRQGFYSVLRSPLYAAYCQASMREEKKLQSAVFWRCTVCHKENLLDRTILKRSTQSRICSSCKAVSWISTPKENSVRSFEIQKM
jgi:hypothetical protein